MFIIWLLLGAALLFLLQRVVYLRYWDRGLRLRLTFDASAITAGETVTVTERAENRKRLPLPVFSYEYTLCRSLNSITQTSGGERLVRVKLAMPARRAVRSQTRLSGLPRGIYSLSGVKMGARDLFYTCKPQKELTCPARLTVYPAQVPAAKLELPFRQILGAVLTRRMTTEDPFQLRGIRPYEVYDSMRDINWKASAKTGELQVNQHEYTTEESLLLLPDMGAGTEAQRETVLSLASSLGRRFLRRGVSVALRSNGRSCLTGSPLAVPPGSGGGHQAVIDEALAQVKLTASAAAPLEDILRALPPKLTARALPVVISAAETAPDLGRPCFFLSVSALSPAPVPGVTIIPWSEGQTEVRL